MQPTSMLRMPRAFSASTSAMAAALLGRKRPLPSAVTVQGQAKLADRCASQRPVSASEIALRRPCGSPASRSTVAVARAQSAAGPRLRAPDLTS